MGARTTDNSDISTEIVINVDAVNINSVGSYSVTYNISDAEGNSAIEVIRTVNVVDTTKPIITLIGDNPQIIELGIAYTELGATVTDNSNISTEIVINVDAVNINSVGSYSVTYNISDAEGNPAIEVIRTVNVVDTTKPIITLNGDNPQVIELGIAYTELGARTTDNSDISTGIVINIDAVNINSVGSYSVTYNISDAEGNPAIEVIRTVNVVDTTKPIITLIGDNTQVIELGIAYTELGATVTDNSNISTEIVIDATDVEVNSVGSYSVTYNISDAAGNSAIEVIRTVNVVDTTKPIITLIGDNPQVIELGIAYTELGARTTDNSNISTEIIINIDAVNINSVGSYSVTYNISDAEGNPAIEVIRTVNVVDTTKPIITLIGDNTQVIELGIAYTELGATVTDNSNISTDIIIVATAVNINSVGSYSVTYNISDAEGNPAIEVIRTVNVVDTTKPIITLIGDNTQVIELGIAYTELGATVTDNSDISTEIVIDATDVEVNSVGSYSVTYNISDAEGNPAIEVIRTVNVVDTTKPIITLIGDNTQVIELGIAYTELEATVTDNSDISTDIIIDATDVEVNSVGSYSVTYNISDAEGNPAIEVIRTVNVVDTTKPIITLIGDNTQVIELGIAYTELGATVTDNSNISTDIIIDATDVEVNSVGSYSVTYNISDAEGNPAIEVIRTVNVVDTTKPIITLNGDNPQVIELGIAYTELEATVTDNSDISTEIVINIDAVNINSVGSYSVTYNISDAEGNSAIEVIRTVNVVDTTKPIITLIGDNPQVIELGIAYTELEATVTDNSDISTEIVINIDAVDVNSVGSYSVTYNISDAAGNPAIEVIRTVNVVDTTKPIITLIGDNTQVIELGIAYTELGARTTDNSNISTEIIINIDAVNINSVGSYSVTYNISDAEGNSAIEVIRTVNVVDTTKPIITPYRR